MILCIHKDNELPEPEILEHLHLIRDTISFQSDLIKHSMNAFLVAAGTAYVPLHEEALAIARQIGKLKIVLSNSSPKILCPAMDIQRILEKGQLGKKRKSFR
jgi:hypothetical protein